MIALPLRKGIICPGCQATSNLKGGESEWSDVVMEVILMLIPNTATLAHRERENTALKALLRQRDDTIRNMYVGPSDPVDRSTSSPDSGVRNAMVTVMLTSGLLVRGRRSLSLEDAQEATRTLQSEVSPIVESPAPG
eukprot:2963767-Rhodomonas_salina.7